MERVPLTPELMTQYRSRQLREMLPKLRVGLIAGALLFLAFLIWDVTIAPAQAARTGPLRLVIAAFYLALLASTWLPKLDRRPDWVMQAAALSGAGIVMAIATLLPLGEVFAAGALMLMVLVVGVLAPNVRIALLSYGALITSANAVAFWRDGGALLIASFNLFVGAGIAVGVLFCRLSDRMSLRSWRLEATLARRASVDSLSGAATRQAFLESAEKALATGRGEGAPFSVLILDVDHFKRINDTYGHATGDLVIRTLAKSCLAHLRSEDVLGRLGGEEFGVLLPRTNESCASTLAERLRAELAGLSVPTHHGEAVGFTVSIGVAQWREPSESIESLLARADGALYGAKHAGRNTITVARAA